jgi:DGQHR domain-containing protein
MTPCLLNKIANQNLSVYKDEINGIQRERDKNKIKEIRKYLIEDKYASFPNTIILAIRDDLNPEAPLFIFDEQDNLSIALESDIANIIDGQHRLAGFSEDEEDFELPVAVFINLPLGEQAKLFAKINSTQTKVNLDIVYENFFKSNERSREKTSFFIVKALNEKENSPWFGKIKTLSDRAGDLAQGSMAKYIDKYLLDVNKPLHELYIQEKDQLIFDLLFNFYSAIKEVFPKAWENSSSEFILTKTTGFNGFMSFFVANLKLVEGDYSELDKDYYVKKFRTVAGEFKDFTNENYPSGAIGQNLIKDTLRNAL